MRRIQDERHGVALRIAAPHHARYSPSRRSCFAIPSCNLCCGIIRQAATSCAPSVSIGYPGISGTLMDFDTQARLLPPGLPLRDNRNDASEPHEFFRVLRFAVERRPHNAHAARSRGRCCRESRSGGLRRDNRSGIGTAVSVQLPVAGHEARCRGRSRRSCRNRHGSRKNVTTPGRGPVNRGHIGSD